MPETQPCENGEAAETPRTCGAQTRAGTPCKKPPLKGRSRCRLHGGLTPVGADSPHFIHGLRSKHMGSALSDVMTSLEEKPTHEMLAVDSEIRILTALEIACDRFEHAADDLETMDVSTRIIERIAKVKQRSQMIMIQAQKLIPSSDVQAFLDHVDAVIFDELEGAQAERVSGSIRNFRLPTPVLKSPRKPTGKANVLSDQYAT